jgi:hypothetical protein
MKTNDYISIYNDYPTSGIKKRDEAPRRKASEASPNRAYFSSLRAAEMAAWELTGGDYLASGFLAEAA